MFREFLKEIILFIIFYKNEVMLVFPYLFLYYTVLGHFEGRAQNTMTIKTCHLIMISNEINYLRMLDKEEYTNN